MQYLTDLRCDKKSIMAKKSLKWTKKDKDLVKKIVEEAKEMLNMQSWFVSNYFEDKTGSETDKEGNTYNVHAMNSVTYEYERINITWYSYLLERIRDKTKKDESRMIIFHEMIHGLTQELYEASLNRSTTAEESRNAVERLTQRIAVICMKTLKKKK